MIDLSVIFAAASPAPADEVGSQWHLDALIAQVIGASGLSDKAASVRSAEGRRVRALRVADDARREAAAVRTARDASIATLAAEGIPHEAIAAACGLTCQRVGQVVSRHRETT